MSQIHHLGLAIKRENYPKYLRLFKKEGFFKVSRGECKIYSTDCTFLSNDFGEIIELCYATKKSSPITKFLEKHQEGFHHLAIQRKHYNDIKGALPNMTINFNFMGKTKFLIEEVWFKEERKE